MKMKYSFILPCRNEEIALPICIKKIRKAMENIKEKAYEIIVSDSSTDKSPTIAKKLKTVLVKHDKVGYGNAYLEGFKKAKGEILILGDADDTYDFLEVPSLLKHIKDNDLILGVRKYLEKDSMPLSNRYLGNPMLSGILRIFFGTKIKDSHTGLRIIRKSALDKLNLRTTGMEFASEMIVKSLKNKLRIKEVPIHYYKRKGVTKLNRVPDAWRHLRFMLLYSPLFLFFIPGLIILLLGLESMLWLYFGSPEIIGLKFFYHPMFVSSLLIIIGYQLVIFSIFARTYAITHLGDESRFLTNIYKYVTIEKAGILGSLLTLSGFLIYIFILTSWIKSGFGDLNEIKNSIIALTLITIGIQTIFSAFMLSILGIKER